MKTTSSSVQERLHKTIARSGLASRRQAEQWIAEGRVRVGGEIVTRVGAKVDPSKDDIRVDGVRVRPDRPRRYILLNKPAGYLTTRSDPRRRPNVMQLLPLTLRALFPVGRLDMSASGLLLLTDDGNFALRVAHPRYGITKTYTVTVRGLPSERSLLRAKKGIRVDGELLRVTSVRLISSRSPDTARLRVVLNEGRYREIWRLFKTLGHPVLELHREKVGFLSDRGLASGAFRPLAPGEIARFLGDSDGRTKSPRTPRRRARSVSKKRRRQD